MARKKAWGCILLCAALAVSPLRAAEQVTPGEGDVPQGTPTPVAEETRTPAPEETATPGAEETRTPAPEETATPGAEETNTPAPEETATPGAEETSTPAPEETATPGAEETNTPAPAYPMPKLGGVTRDEQQENPDAVSVHIAMQRAQEDTRALELIVLPVEEEEIRTLEAYLKLHPVDDQTFAANRALSIDEQDAQRRYRTEIPYGVRFVLAWRVAGAFACEGIFAAYVRPEESQTPDVPPQETPEPSTPDEPTEEPEMEPEEEMEIIFFPSIGYYAYPKDEDGDGLYTRTEYRIDLDPAKPDSDEDGYWDFMDFYLQGRLCKGDMQHEPVARTLDASVHAGLLGEGAQERWPGDAARDMSRRWPNSGTAPIGWANLSQAQVLAICNRGVFWADYTRDEQPTIVRALSMDVLGYPAANRYERTRIFDVSADGTLALLYDRAIDDDTKGEDMDTGTLTQDAVLIDTVNMCAYPIIDTKGARSVALSLDGSLLAVWRDDALEIWQLETGLVARITDERQLARVETIAFTQDNRLVVSVTQMGCNAFAPDGTPVIIGAQELGVFVRSRDFLGMSVYDNEHALLRIDAQVYLTPSGIYVKGEDGKSTRHFSPRQIRLAAGIGGE